MKSAQLIELAAVLAETQTDQSYAEAAFRKSVSASYYSLFHEMTKSCISQLVASDVVFQQKVMRRIGHNNLRKVCETYIRRKDTPDSLRMICETFVFLHGNRQIADYELLNSTVDQELATNIIHNTQAALAELEKLNSDPHNPDFQQFCQSVLLSHLVGKGVGD